MKELFEILNHRPALFEQGKRNMWDDPHISKELLKDHLNESLDSATRKIEYVNESVDWISGKVPSGQFKNLLDLGCGPGIYTELFHKKGYKVCGIDLSRTSIQYARDSACSQKLDIQYIWGDYTEIDINDHFNIITLIYCDFGVLSKSIRRKLLKKIYNLLLPNGIFVFDVFKPLKYEGAAEKREWEICEQGFWSEDRYILFHSFYRYDEANTYLNQYVVAAEHNVTFYNIWEHTFTFTELRQDLEEAGFINIEFYGDMSGKSCSDSDRTICILAGKM